IAGTLPQLRQVVPQRRDEAAVAATRAMAAQPGFEDHNVEARLELLQLPSRPHAEITAADDHDVSARVPFERARRCDRPECSRRLLEPPARARVPHPAHAHDPRLPGGYPVAAAWWR